MAPVSRQEGDRGWNSPGSDKLWQEQESGRACCRTEHSLVRTPRPWETQGRNANRKTERDREGKKRQGDSNTSSTLQRDTEDALLRLLWRHPSSVWSQSQRPFTSGFTVSVRCIISSPAPLAAATSCFSGQALGPISQLRTLWLAALRLSRCPKAAKIDRTRKKRLCWSSHHHISPIVPSSDSVFVLPFSETGFFFIPLSSYNLLFLPTRNWVTCSLPLRPSLSTVLPMLRCQLHFCYAFVTSSSVVAQSSASPQRRFNGPQWLLFTSGVRDTVKEPAAIISPLSPGVTE